MHERNDGRQDQVDKKSKFKEKALLIAGVSGFYGGVSYGIARIVSDAELAEKVGISVGGVIAGAGIAVEFGDYSSKIGEKLAVQGKDRAAFIKMLQASIKASLGFGLSFAVPGYEVAGIRGGMFGGALGAVSGAMKHVHSPGYFKEFRNAYKSVIHPGSDPKNFPEWDIIKDELFDDDDVLLESPVYVARSIADMRGFRKSQVDWAIEKSRLLSRRLSPESNNQEVILGKMSSAIFIIPDLSHFPVYDPKDGLNVIELRDSKDSLIAHQKKYPPEIWEYDTAFAGKVFAFDANRWQYWRENSWKHDVALLVKREVKKRKSETSKEPIVEATDKYYIIDIITDVPVSGPTEKDKEELKKLIKARGLKPVWNPGA